MGNKRTEAEWEEHKFQLENRHFKPYVMKRINAYRKENNGKHLFVYATMDRRKGVSDLICSVGGLFLALELKVGNNKPSALQDEFIHSVKCSGGDGFVCYTWGDVKKVLNYYLAQQGCPLI